MQGYALDPADPTALPNAVGLVIAEELDIEGRRAFHKGHVIREPDLPRLGKVARRFHAVRLAPDEVHEDEAGRRLADAVAGPGVETTEPKLSRVNLRASAKGLLRVDGARLTAINRLPGVAVFTLPDRIVALAGQVVAGAKITPVAVPDATLAGAEGLAAGPPVVEVKPFRPLKVGVISTEHLEGRPLERFQESVRTKIGWFGGTVHGFEEQPRAVPALKQAIERRIAEGCELILVAGGNAMDPLDAALLTLPEIGAERVKVGAPVHPGSMFWLAYAGDVPIFNLASCSLYSRATSADLVLPWIMAGERVTLDDMAGLGFGGLLEGKEVGYRFPPYGE
ncbi:MAG: molybdopterin-binding protein [Thermomicrobiales bacterium]|nr:molybdopterin-binding protein [Thermomicrobiales bacterium]